MTTIQASLIRRLYYPSKVQRKVYADYGSNCLYKHDTISNTKAQFLVLLVNYSVSKPSVNYNSLVKFVRASEQNLDYCQLTEQ